MKKIKVYPVILSGGSGTRLWPWSRKKYPKQYLNIIGEKLNIMEKKGTAKPNQDNTINPTAESEVDIDEQARLHY